MRQFVETEKQTDFAMGGCLLHHACADGHIRHITIETQTQKRQEWIAWSVSLVLQSFAVSLRNNLLQSNFVAGCCRQALRILEPPLLQAVKY